MKFFVCIALIAIAASALAAPSSGSSAASSNAGGSVANQESEAEGQGYGDLTRLRKSAYGGSSGGYGGSSVPAPPCPKNYLFSCQPNLAPVPCSAPAPSYGSAGAYSSPVASYVAPNYGVPQHQQSLYGSAYLPQAYGYQY
ncbi:vitelline membrane protein Vm26Aa-like [Drosophila novamexicana]|uniref:vitelline membrane protein Vm26Aa-like n=1 Tax=Drosophila novamexicana TaxID=47314 RepID=UPI0011E5C395|nr:vitelline membrane protein Vm26Aa-like [Drosophila novamexicana]